MRTQDARNIHIVDYLDRIGAQFARSQMGTHGLEFVFHSPNRDDRKPSLCVNIEKNIWSDVPQGAWGRLIELVCYLNALASNSVREALAILDRLYPTVPAFLTLPSMRSNTAMAYWQTGAIAGNRATGLKKKGAIDVIRTGPLCYYPLVDYLSNTRHITWDIAVNIVEEVHYKIQATGTICRAIGFRCGETYALRNKYFKWFSGPGVGLRVFERKTNAVVVFEGFMDYLTYLSAKKLIQPQKTVVVMNSSTMQSKLIEFIRQHPTISTIEYFRDRDEEQGKQTGLLSFQNLQRALPAHRVMDCSVHYQGFNDLNERWVHQNRR